MLPQSNRTTRLSVGIRNATAADVSHILRLTRGLAEYERLLHKTVSTEADFLAMMFGANPRAYALLAEFPGQVPVGLALYYYTFSTFAGRSGIFLEDLFVEAQHRGEGIGLALLRALAKRAVAEDCYTIEWRVLNWNEPAIDFYERLGAATTDEWHARQLGSAALRALAEGNIHG